MDFDTMNTPRFRNFVLLLLCASVLPGCGRKTAAPSAPTPRTLSGMTRDRTHYTYLKWDEGLAVMLVDWCDGHSSGSGKPGQRNGDAHWWDKESEQWNVAYEWQLETTDGRTAKFMINNVEYDLSKGAVFRIDTGSDEVAAGQINRDLSNIPTDKNACDHFVTATPELRKSSEKAGTK